MAGLRAGKLGDQIGARPLEVAANGKQWRIFDHGVFFPGFVGQLATIGKNAPLLHKPKLLS